MKIAYCNWSVYRKDGVANLDIVTLVAEDADIVCVCVCARARTHLYLCE